MVKNLKYLIPIAVVIVILVICQCSLPVGTFGRVNSLLTLIRKADVSSPSYSSTSSCPPNKHRRTFIALLQHWDDISKHHNISYVIGLGSLLGQYRTKDIIPWDNDIDVLVDVNDFKTLKLLGEERDFKAGWDDKIRILVQLDYVVKEEKFRRRLTCNGKLVHRQVDKCSFAAPMARVMQGYKSLDIFAFIVKGSIVHDVELKKDHNKIHFFPFKRCNFMDVQTWCPNNSRRVLESGYGDLRPAFVCRYGKWISREKLN